MDVEAFLTSGGTIQGLSLNFATWIRDYWWLPMCSMPDIGNDKVQGSLAVRNSPKNLLKFLPEL